MHKARLVAQSKNESKTPSIAASVVPDVDGDINLLLLSDCMISPETLSPEAVSTIAMVRGRRLTQKICQAAGSNFSRF